MSWRISPDGYIVDELGNVVCVLPSGIEPEVASKLAKANEMFEAIEDFCEETQSGRLRAKRAYNNFVVIINEIRGKKQQNIEEDV